MSIYIYTYLEFKEIKLLMTKLFLGGFCRFL